MDLESFNTSRESLVPLLALSNKTNKNIIIFPTDKEAIEFANLVAGVSVTREGAANSMPYKKELF